MTSTALNDLAATRCDCGDRLDEHLHAGSLPPDYRGNNRCTRCTCPRFHVTLTELYLGLEPVCGCITFASVAAYADAAEIGRVVLGGRTIERRSVPMAGGVVVQPCPHWTTDPTSGLRVPTGIPMPVVMPA